MASAVIGSLRVNLGIDSAQFSTGLKQADGKLSEFGRSAQRSASNVTAFRGGIQNTAFQLQDFAVQVSGGTSAMRALSQQLPQMLGSFGVMGAVIGGVVAAIPLIIMGFQKLGSSSLSLTDQIKGLDEALSGLKDVGIEVSSATDLLNASLTRMAVGRAKSEIAGLRETIAGLIADADVGFGERIGGVIPGIIRLQSELKLAAPQARELFDALTALTRAPMEELAGKAQDVLRVFASIAAETGGELRPELQEVADAVARAAQLANSLAGNTDGATAAAGRLQTAWMGVLAAAQSTMMAAGRAEAALAMAHKRQQEINNTRPTSLGGPGRGGPANFPLSGVPGIPWDTLFPLAGGGDLTGTPEPPKTGGGKKGGISAIEKALNDLKATSERVFAATRTPMEEYNATIAELGVLLKTTVDGKTLIDLDTYNRAVIQAKETLAKAGETGENSFKQLGDSFKDVVADVLQGTATIRDAMSSMLAQISSELISSGLTTLFKPAGGLVSGILDAIGVQHNALGTQFSRGGLSIVGERGPELVHLPRGSKVTPNSRLGGGGGLVYAPVIDARGADPAAITRLELLMRSQAADFERTFRDRTMAAVADPRYRGRS